MTQITDPTIIEKSKSSLVPPFNKDDIVKIIQEAILNGTITSEKTTIDPTKTYVLKIDKGEIALVEEQSEE